MSDSAGGPPKRDKFAALAGRSEAAAAPKRDRFAALAASTTPAVVESVAAAPAPKRDKFAALAASSSTTSVAAATATATAPKRDKFAALGQRAEVKDDSSAAAPSASSPEEDEVAAKEKNRLLLEQRQHQRAHVWKDLDDAQGLVLDLLEHAQQTAATLAAHTSTAAEDADDDANGSLVSITRRLAARTRETLAHLHAKLAPHADLVKAYQEPQRVNRMYQARIEEGLARQKKELLSRMVALEQQAKQQSSPAAAVVVVAESTEPVAVVHGESRKRKLDDEETAQSNKLAKM